MDKVQEKLALHNASSLNMHEVEDAIFTEVVREERNGWVRGLGMGPTPSSYFGAGSSCQRQPEKEVSNLKDELKSMKERLKHLETEREAECAQVEVERAQMQVEHA
ncbi:hypothetical protein PTKIN_Ptkin04bG0165600 [Pterospermum kingtungense]